MNKKLRCPFCSEYNLLRKEVIVSPLNKKEYTLYLCKSCLLQFFTPLEFEDVYESELNESYKEFHKGRKILPDWTMELIKFLRKNNFQYRSGCKILEIGAGDGINFIALNKNFNVLPEDYYAVELDKKSIDVCKQRGIENIFSCYFDSKFLDIIKQKFDIILITEVLEHQVSPREFLDVAFDLLSRDGILIITVPNSRRAFIQQRSKDGDVPPHHFLRFNKEFFLRNFPERIAYLKDYCFLNKSLQESSEILSKFFFKTEYLFMFMLPVTIVLRFIDRIWGEGIIVVLKK